MRRASQERTPLEGCALDRCEETFSRRAWDSFAYWHAIYVLKRRKSHNVMTNDLGTEELAG